MVGRSFSINWRYGAWKLIEHWRWTRLLTWDAAAAEIAGWQLGSAWSWVGFGVSSDSDVSTVRGRDADYSFHVYIHGKGKRETRIQAQHTRTEE